MELEVGFGQAELQDLPKQVTQLDTPIFSYLMMKTSSVFVFRHSYFIKRKTLCAT